MPIYVHRHFHFDQHFVQDAQSQGWCAGISMALLTHLQECQDRRDLAVERCHDLAHAYVRLLGASTDPVQRMGCTPSFGAFRDNIAGVQELYHFAAYRSRHVDPTQERGRALLALSLAQHHGVGDGALFRAPDHDIPTPQTASANHCGMIVWHAQRMFVFDPNTGGCTVTWLAPGPEEPRVAAVDQTLAWLHAHARPPTGRRWPKLLKLIQPFGWPYGQV